MKLSIDAIDCYYGQVQVLHGFSLELRPGEVLALLGHNGAGKTTLLKSIMGLVRPRRGHIRLGERTLSDLPAHRVPQAGIGYVPQGRRLFAELTVAENLTLGLMARNRPPALRARLLDLFPVLRERLNQAAGTLSGGEQEMLAIARALCLEPEMLLLDEPTEGLMPSMIAAILETVRRLKSEGVATLLVEQRVETALAVADRIAFIENGRAREVTTPAALRADPTLLHRYVGVGLARL